MALIPIRIPPGINKETPSLTSDPAWRDADKVRFKYGQPEKMGAWVETFPMGTPFEGTARSIISWRSNSGFVMTAIGTHKKLYLYTTQYFDITPIRSWKFLSNPIATVNASTLITINDTLHGLSTGDGVIINDASASDFVNSEMNQQHIITVVDANSYTFNIVTPATGTNAAIGGTVMLDYPMAITFSESNPFDITISSTTVVVNHTNHGALTGDYVTFSDATDANFVDSEVNANHVITFIDANSYSFEMTTAATATTTGTGGTVGIAYEVPVGNEFATSSFGFGSAAWGQEAWGDERTIASDTTDIRYWGLDHFGEDLVACYNGSRTYTWDFSTSVTTRATVINSSPEQSDLVIVTNPDRHLVTFASNSVGFQDKMLVRWADQETITDWTATAENTAGDHILSGGSKIFATERSQSSTLIWTDGGLHSMEFIGPPFTFGFNELGRNCGAISHECVVTHNSVSYWMSDGDFFMFDGVVRTIPCSVHRYVFDNLNPAQRTKVVAGLIKNFHEVIWLYADNDSNEINKYVIYNYEEKIWYNGSFDRTIWLDSELHQYPLAADNTGKLYHHEFKDDTNMTADAAFIESAEFDIGEGDKFLFARRVIPDMVIDNGDVTFTFKTRRYPHTGAVTETPMTVTAATEKLDVRFRGRQMAIRIDSDLISDDWHMGTPRVDARLDGKR